MYKLMTFKDSVRIPPAMLAEDLKESVYNLLNEKLARTIDKDYGIIISVENPEIKSNGKIVHGDVGVYVDVEFDCIVFSPKINEIVEGEVSEIVEFGAFVNLGPMDGLAHVSQISDEFMSFDKKTGGLIGKKTKKTLKKGEIVKCKIATISFKDTIQASKIGIVMRQNGLGKAKK